MLREKTKMAIMLLDRNWKWHEFSVKYTNM